MDPRHAGGSSPPEADREHPLATCGRTVIENASRAFDGATEQKGASSREAELARRIEQLEAKLAKKDAIIAEISEEYVTLKKELGEP